MKKLVVKFCVFLICVSSAFAGWFDERYVELGVEVPVGVSNNSIQISDVLTKHPVIDLRKLADEMPADGLQLNTYMNPNLTFSVRVKDVKIAGKTGVETFGTASVSKDLFEYIGYGNKLGEKISISQKVNADVFAFQEVSAAFNVRDFRVVVKPALFVPFFHVGSSHGVLELHNDLDGSLKVNYESELEIYSAIDIKEKGRNFIPGFDLAGSVSYPLFDFLLLTGNFRIPIVPGKLGYKMTATTTMNFETSVDKIIDGNVGEKNFSNELSDATSASYSINRPMKFSAFADFTPLGNWVVFTGGLGIGFLHPFTDDTDTFDFFGEYYLGGRLLLGNALSVGISSQYYEKIFIHQFDFMINLRIFELDAGINSQAASFLKSCSAGGVGAFVAVKLGF